MNAHFSNAVNSVAFTWGTQKTYHAAQFGTQFDYPRPSKVKVPLDESFPYFPAALGAAAGSAVSPFGSLIGGAGAATAVMLRRQMKHRAEVARQEALNDRLRQNTARAGVGPAADMAPFWSGHSERFKGDETGGLDEYSILTDEKKRRIMELLDMLSQRAT